MENITRNKDYEIFIARVYLVNTWLQEAKADFLLKHGYRNISQLKREQRPEYQNTLITMFDECMQDIYSKDSKKNIREEIEEHYAGFLHARNRALGQYVEDRVVQLLSANPDYVIDRDVIIRARRLKDGALAAKKTAVNKFYDSFAFKELVEENPFRVAPNFKGTVRSLSDIEIISMSNHISFYTKEDLRKKQLLDLQYAKLVRLYEDVFGKRKKNSIYPSGFNPLEHDVHELLELCRGTFALNSISTAGPIDDLENKLKGLSYPKPVREHFSRDKYEKRGSIKLIDAMLGLRRFPFDWDGTIEYVPENVFHTAIEEIRELCDKRKLYIDFRPKRRETDEGLNVRPYLLKHYDPKNISDLVEHAIPLVGQVDDLKRSSARKENKTEFYSSIDSFRSSLLTGVWMDSFREGLPMEHILIPLIDENNPHKGKYKGDISRLFVDIYTSILGHDDLFMKFRSEKRKNDHKSNVCDRTAKHMQAVFGPVVKIRG